MMSGVQMSCSDVQIVPVDEAPGTMNRVEGALHALLHLEQHPGRVDHASITSAR